MHSRFSPVHGGRCVGAVYKSRVGVLYKATMGLVAKHSLFEKRLRLLHPRPRHILPRPESQNSRERRSRDWSGLGNSQISSHAVRNFQGSLCSRSCFQTVGNSSHKTLKIPADLQSLQVCFVTQKVFPFIDLIGSRDSSAANMNR
jgi:hypothetical protein